jgi:hypothetical protein
MTLDLSSLPEEIRLIIFEYVISNFLIEKKLKLSWRSRKEKIIDFNFIGSNLDRFNNNGYVKFDSNLIRAKFPNINLNPLIEINFLKKVVADLFENRTMEFEGRSDIKEIIISGLKN